MDIDATQMDGAREPAATLVTSLRCSLNPRQRSTVRDDQAGNPSAV